MCNSVNLQKHIKIYAINISWYDTIHNWFTFELSHVFQSCLWFLRGKAIGTRRFQNEFNKTLPVHLPSNPVSMINSDLFFEPIQACFFSLMRWKRMFVALCSPSLIRWQDNWLWKIEVENYVWFEIFKQSMNLLSSRSKLWNT